MQITSHFQPTRAVQAHHLNFQPTRAAWCTSASLTTHELLSLNNFVSMVTILRFEEIAKNVGFCLMSLLIIAAACTRSSSTQL